VTDHARLTEKLQWRRSPDPEGRFLNVFMDQNNKCNLRCRMCGFADPRVAGIEKFEMPRELFDSIARQLFPRATYVQLSILTEPFMTADFPDRLRAVREYEVPYSHIITNGTLLTSRAIEAVLDAAISCLTISIDAGTKEVFESIRIGSSFEQVIRNFELLREKRDARGATLPRLRINHRLMYRNVDHFDDFAALLERIRPDELDIKWVEPMGYVEGYESRDPAFVAKYLAIRPRVEEVCSRAGIEHAAFMRDRATPIHLFLESGEQMTCRRPWDTFAIHANGDVHPCMAWTRPPVGNLALQTYDEIVESDAMTALRQEFDIAKPGVDCEHCTIKKSEAYGVYDDFFFRMLNKTAPAVTAG
jgi:radical SAM protein with 4Fe4S-binding SPASM domain